MDSLLEEKLPSNWKYTVTCDGRVFFMNDERETSTWVHPIWKQTVQTGHFKNPDLPDGVEFDYTFQGTPYIIDHNNSSVSWSLPPQEKVEMRRDSKRSISPFKRTNSKRKSLKKKSVDVKRNRNSEVLMRGWLHRQEGGIGPLKSWKKRWFVLSDLCLFIYKGPEEGDLLVSILLPSYKITPGQKDSSNKKFIFKAEHENMKSEHFAGETVEEAERWMEAMHLASLAVDNNFTEYGDNIRDAEPDSNLNLKLSASLPHVQNEQIEQNIVKNHETPEIQNFNDYKNNQLRHEQLPTDDVKNLQQNNLVAQQNNLVGQQNYPRVHERLNFRNHSTPERGYDNNPTNVRSMHDWMDFDATNKLKSANEMLPINLDGNNLSRVKEWTEEQNKFRIEMLASKSLINEALDSSIDEQRLESVKWMKLREEVALENVITYPEDSDSKKFKAQMIKSTNSFQQMDLQDDILPNNNYKINNCSNQSAVSMGTSILLSRQSSKNNSEEQNPCDSKEPEITKSSNKSSISSNLSNFVKTGVASLSMEDASLQSLRQTNTDTSLSSELNNKNNIDDVILKTKMQIEESRDLLEIFNQILQKTSAQKEKLVNVLIGLWKDQTILRELHYNLITQDDFDSNSHHQTIQDLINENSHLTNQLENCLYGTSSKNVKIHDNNKITSQALIATKNKTERPQPMKRSTTHTTHHSTSPLTIPTLDTNVPMISLDKQTSYRNDYIFNKDKHDHDFQQEVTSNQNLYIDPVNNEMFGPRIGMNLPTNLVEHKKSLMRSERPRHADNKNIIYGLEQQMKTNVHEGANKFENQIIVTRPAAITDDRKLYNSVYSKKIYGAEHKTSNLHEAKNDHSTSRVGPNVAQNLEDKKALIRHEFFSYADNQDRNKINSNHKIKNNQYNETSANDSETTFLETDLDSMQTCNIAKFSYGVKLSDLNRSPAFQKIETSLDKKLNLSRGIQMTNNCWEPKHHGLTKSHEKQILGPGHNRHPPTRDAIPSANFVHKELKENKPEFMATEQYKQSIVPLKSSNHHVPNLYSRRSRNETSENQFKEQHNHSFSGVRQRTHSLSNDEGKEFKDNNLRNIKSTQNLNDDEDVENETQKGFSSRSNIRRLSGIFTPRPFYKSRSTTEVQKPDESKLINDRERISRVDLQKSNMAARDGLNNEPSNRRKESSEQSKEIRAFQNMAESQRREMKSDNRERIENERRWKQEMLQQRFGQTTSRTNYYGEILLKQLYHEDIKTIIIIMRRLIQYNNNNHYNHNLHGYRNCSYLKLNFN